MEATPRSGSEDQWFARLGPRRRSSCHLVILSRIEIERDEEERQDKHDLQDGFDVSLSLAGEILDPAA